MNQYTKPLKLLCLSLVLIIAITGCRPSVLETQPPVDVQLKTTPTKRQQTAPTLSLQNLIEKTYDGRNLTVGRVLEKNSFYTRYYITYLSGELKISGIMNVPTGDGTFPVLILNHGYIDPAIYTNGRGLKREQDYFARRGYIVIHPDYRNHADSDKDEQAELRFRLGYTEDVINVVYAVRTSELPYFDKDNIGMMGHSMGGGVTQNVLVTQPNLIKAASLYAPVSSNVIDNFNRWTRSRPEVVAKIVAEHGEPETNPEFYDGLSPINYLDRIQAPVILHHGTNDQDVPIAWSETLNQALRDADKSIIYHVYQGEGHEFGSQWTTFMERNVVFFDQYLK